MNTAKILTLIALLALASHVLADDALAVEQEGGIRFIVGSPTGEFGDAVEDPGFGLSAHYGVRPVPAFTLGVGGDVMIYGSESRTISLPLVEDFDLTTDNNLASGFLFAQYRPFSGCVQPYGEARLGIRYLWTESKLEDEDWWDDDDIASETNYDDFATYWGVGGGLMVQVYKADPLGDSPNVFIDFKVNYTHGSEAEYLTDGDIEIVNNVPVFDVSQSETDLTSFELGVVFTF